MKKIFIDFETASEVPISLGARAYVSGKHFKATALAYAVDGGRITVTTDFKKIPPGITAAMKTKHVFIAHNADFDAAVFAETYGKSIPNRIDTAALCRYHSVPASLDGACGFFGLGQKDPAGKKLISKTVSGKTLDAQDMRALLKYARQDLVLLRRLYKVFENRGFDPFSEKVLKLHWDMNASGIAVDLTRAKRLHTVILEEKTRTEKRARKLYGTYGKDKKAVASSAAQVKEYLNAKGFQIESIGEKELEDFLNVSGSKLPADCAGLISCFREIQSRGADKAGLLVENQIRRIYDSSIYHGAHTGRPSGGGVNLFNVKRYTDGDEGHRFDKSLKLIVKTARRGEKVKRLSSLLWGCLRFDVLNSVIVRSDLSAIEPRVGAWLRDDQKTLDIYRQADAGTGKDEYTIFGESMNFPKSISRNLSKIVILAACYGMGAPRFRFQCRSWGMPDPGEQESERILEGYHRRNPSVKRTWFSMIRLAVQALAEGTGTIEGGNFVSGHHLKMRTERIAGKTFLSVLLPSGRVKRYADARIETAGSKGWKTFSYIDPVKNFRQCVSPGSFYENIVQAAAADVGFEKALAMPEENVKLIIYDELNISTSRKHADKIKKIMNAPVSWLPGMPVSAKTSVCSTFHKGDTV